MNKISHPHQVSVGELVLQVLLQLHERRDHEPELGGLDTDGRVLAHHEGVDDRVGQQTSQDCDDHGVQHFVGEVFLEQNSCVDGQWQQNERCDYNKTVEFAEVGLREHIHPIVHIDVLGARAALEDLLVVLGVLLVEFEEQALLVAVSVACADCDGLVVQDLHVARFALLRDSILSLVGVELSLLLVEERQPQKLRHFSISQNYKQSIFKLNPSLLNSHLALACCNSSTYQLGAIVENLFRNIRNNYDTSTAKKGSKGCELEKSNDGKLFDSDLNYLNMIGSDKRVEQRYCNCKHSRCMKLYCECLSARVACGKNCRCIGCQNIGGEPQLKYFMDKKLMRGHKGCACRRSNCTKKYCDCFQAGIVCGESCKCLDCQNNESLTNRRVIDHLRTHQSEIEMPQAAINLYPLYISQNSDHLHSIVTDSNPLGLHESWLEKCASRLYEHGHRQGEGPVVYKFIEILAELEQNLNRQIRYKQEQFNEGLEESPNDHKQHKIDQMNKIEYQSQQQLQQNQVQAHSKLSPQIHNQDQAIQKLQQSKPSQHN